MDESQKHYPRQKKPDTKKSMYHSDSNVEQGKLNYSNKHRTAAAQEQSGKKE